MNLKTSLLLVSTTLGAFPSAAMADEVDAPASLEALEEFRNGAPRPNPVQNRFFLKGKRFELNINAGVEPTNPLARRFSVGLAGGYHFSENLAVMLHAAYSPDLGVNDLKSLTTQLILLADQGEGNEDFEQPLTKSLFTVDLGVQWTPFYGKLNLIGEAVLNFDFYLYAGAALVIDQAYTASKNPEYDENDTQPYVSLAKGAIGTHPGGSLGLGAHLFLTQSVTLTVEGRGYLYYTTKAVQDEAGNTVNQGAAGGLFSASFGVSIFLPKMKPRITEF